MTDYRKNPKTQKVYGIYNYGRLVDIARTRKAAIKLVEENTRKPWSEARELMEVHPVVVEKQA